MFKAKLKIIGCGLLIVLLDGCAYVIPFLDSAEPTERAEIQEAKDCEIVEKPEEKVKLQIIRQLMDNGKLHAALAHLDAAGVRSAHEAYMRAEILRKTGRAELAVPLYTQLIHGCAAGRAYHGLGLISGRDGKIGEALDFLEKARSRLPTDIQVRNDLGYALFLDRQYEPARHEFLTALELDEGNEFSVSNLILLLLVTDQYQNAQSLAVRMKLSGESFNQLVTQAKNIKASAEGARPAGEGEPDEAGPGNPAEKTDLSKSKGDPPPKALEVAANGGRQAGSADKKRKARR